jgi:hypothetical protein
MVGINSFKESLHFATNMIFKFLLWMEIISLMEDHHNLFITESHLEGVNRANLKFINLSTTTSRVSVRNINESEREGEKQIAGK